MQKKHIIYCSFLLILWACSSEEDKTNENVLVEKSAEKAVKIVSPKNGQEFSNEDSIDFEVAVLKDDLVDSVLLYFDNKPLRTMRGQVATKELTLGEHFFKTKTYLKSGKIEVESASILQLSNIIPEEKTYRVIQIYHHNPDDYTQGIEIIDGVVYESTGQYGESMVKVWDLKTGKVLKERWLDESFFGEGLSIVGDKIYQLTWRENTGFVYDIETLSPIQQFSFENEGWGLAYDGTYLIQSDGTNRLTFYTPENLQKVKQLNVFDEVTGVYDINELEWINGLIYANIYRTNIVVVIDPITGKVLSRIDLSGLLNHVNVEDEVDVLNGIAFDKATKKIYVTGKWWPAIFEVEFLPANNK